MKNEVIDFSDTQILGQYRTFGEAGPAYRIIKPIRQDDSGNWYMTIEVPSTGEITEYPYSEALSDPIAS